MSTYQAFEVQSQFGIDSLTLSQRNTPILKPRQLLIQIKAVALNYRDYLMVKGQYNPRQPLPFIPCSDGAGVVVEAGEGATLKVGTRVMPLFAQGWMADQPNRITTQNTLGGPLDGTLTEYMCIDESGVIEIPEYLSDQEASTLGCAGLTAWSALAELGEVKAGDQVVCLGTGGVSLFAAQIAHALGAEVWVTSRSSAKLDRLTSEILGFHLDNEHKILADQGGWGSSIRKRSWKGQGVDHIIEVGGAQTLSESLKAIRPGGTLSLIGILSGHQAPLNLLPILMRQIKVQGVFVGHKCGFERFNQALSFHKIHPVIDQVFAFKKAQDAFHTLARGQHMGKIVLDVHTE